MVTLLTVTKQTKKTYLRLIEDQRSQDLQESPRGLQLTREFGPLGHTAL